jgi:hypothetical protein
MGLDNILRCYVLNHEQPDILWECHNGFARGHVRGKETARNILQEGLWWPTMFKYAKEYAQACNVCQRVGNPSHRDELPLHPVRELQAFEKRVVGFVGSINPPTKHLKARYIITATDYLNQWDEAKVVWDCSTATTTQFIFQNIITQFGCPWSLTSDQGSHFLSETIVALTREL